MHRTLSAIVPAYGNADHVAACIEALRRATDPPEEIIIVDDGTPGGLHVAGDDVRVVRHAENRGPSAARNSGARGAAGDWLMFVDADIEISPDGPQRVRETLARQPDVSLVFGVYAEDRDAPVISAYKNLYWRHKFLGLPVDSPNVNSALMAVRREIFGEVRGFNESTSIGEDREFGHAVAARGYGVRLDKALSGAHRKRFTFGRLAREHFTSTVNATLVLLATRVPVRAGDREVLGARYRFLASVAVAGAAGVALVAAVLLASRPLTLAAGVLVALFGILSADLLAAARRLRGWWFAVVCLGLALVEGIVASAGVVVALARYFIAGNPRRDFRI